MTLKIAKTAQAITATKTRVTVIGLRKPVFNPYRFRARDFLMPSIRATAPPMMHAVPAP
jgi:hypothetical protein